jgi:hypothetical protein
MTTENPALAAARAVDSTPKFVAMPAMTTVLIRACSH